VTTQSEPLPCVLTTNPCACGRTPQAHSMHWVAGDDWTAAWWVACQFCKRASGCYTNWPLAVAAWNKKGGRLPDGD
jgi:hypothetical protein